MVAFQGLGILCPRSDQIRFANLINICPVVQLPFLRSFKVTLVESSQFHRQHHGRLGEYRNINELLKAKHGETML